ncbi:MAG TPA: energy transducer TonB [Pyrinomonadaceae bacterium]|nr:energy transducer TonB [Pyrinomonadaceae bacterium]
MRNYRLLRAARGSGKWFLILSLIVVGGFTVGAQTTTDAEATMQRVTRARALAASHNLAAAAAELGSIIGSTNDDAMRDVARIMLMHVYLEEANYTKADALLVETFQARSAQKESSIRSYFALAGQTINGARAHLERYRSFGINVSDAGLLPPEAVNDLDKLRLLLERVVEQAKEINNEGAKRSDAAALLEEAAGVRGTLARNEGERQQWQREIAGARESLAATETRIASNAGASTPPASVAAAAPGTSVAPANSTTTAPSAAGQSNAAPAVARTASTEARPPAPARQSDAHGSTPDGGGSSGSSAQDSQLMNVGSLFDRATQKVAPSYPATARGAHVSGVVTVFLEVDEKGSVVAVPRTDGPPLLRQAAVDAARKWKFRPTVIDGQAVRVMGFISFNFTL